MLQETYINLLKNYTDDISLIDDLWKEIIENYSDKKRHYHTLSHLNNLLLQLIEVKDKIENWETILFTLYYHDIIYNALKLDNEFQSVELMEIRLKHINVPIKIIDKCKNQILATKKHFENSDLDTNYFTDADLSVLGQEIKDYNEYSEKVRLEYLFYPSIVYNEGRLKILNDFLNLNQIYKTEYFHKKFEEKAILNISEEIKKLDFFKEKYYLSYSNQWIFCIENDGDYSEFLYFGAQLLDQTQNVEKIEYYPGFFDSGYYRFYYKNVKLHLEWEGMLGVDLRTEPNPSESDLIVTQEIYELLKTVRNKNYA